MTMRTSSARSLLYHLPPSLNTRISFTSMWSTTHRHLLLFLLSLELRFDVDRPHPDHSSRTTTVHDERAICITASEAEFRVLESKRRTYSSLSRAQSPCVERSRRAELESPYLQHDHHTSSHLHFTQIR